MAYPLLAFMLRIFAATILGAVIGFERTKRSKEAGIRTHCIICCASSLIMVISIFGFSGGDGTGLYTSGASDAARIAAQVVSGISFLGAGVIFKNGNTVKGLTTAAGIWATAGIGLACGCGLYVLAIFTTVLIMAVQLVFHRFNLGYDAYSSAEIHIVMKDSPAMRKILQEKQEELGISIQNSTVTVKEDDMLELTLSVQQKANVSFEEILQFMDEHPDIKSITM